MTDQIATLPLVIFGQGDDPWGAISYDDAIDTFTSVLDYFDDGNTIEAEKARLVMIKAAKRYYEGKHVKPFKVDPGQPDDNVIVNLCRTLIDDSASWLFGDPETGVLTFEIAGEDSTGEEGNWFDELWEANGGLELLKRIAKRGGISGHTFVKLDLPGESGVPVISALKPEMMSVMTDPRDDDRVIAYNMEWITKERDPATFRKTEYIYRQLTVNAGDKDNPFWMMAEFRSPNRKRRKWEIVAGPEGWAWPWSPIHDCPNIDPPWGYYGLSDLEDAAWLNDNLNFIASNTMRIIKFHAHPRTIGTGFKADDIQDTSVDAFWTIPTEAAKVYNLEMQSDLQSSMGFLDFVRGAFWTIGRGMDVSVYKDKIGQITNFALRVLAIRALNKMGDKRLSYGRLIKEINDHAQEILNVQTPMGTVINWPVPLPVSDKEELENLSAEVAMEITSKQTASEERGRNWEKERQRIKVEKQSAISLGQYIISEFDRGETDDDF